MARAARIESAASVAHLGAFQRMQTAALGMQSDGPVKQLLLQIGERRILLRLQVLGRQVRHFWQRHGTVCARL